MLLLRIAYVTVGPTTGGEGTRCRSLAFFSRCSRRPCPARGGGGAGGAHPTTKVAAVEGFLHLNLDLHVVVVHRLKFKISLLPSPPSLFGSFRQSWMWFPTHASLFALLCCGCREGEVAARAPWRMFWSSASSLREDWLVEVMHDASDLGRIR
ncbi:uncharacterized protein LOC123427223 [Hordeum vulgare subsp. vulgare]|uniref:uncharacterized protein LOC123427223 n=1 Tax=Hordeum vulgare subsp. vulgare TaxID=112509 RepID=UPI001D1A388E|nr:uncharacterized protein LOC123427223 [Hordeum vulgare subsp. vulgare]